MSEIKNIIFDLGGVIINLDIPKTITEFNKLTSKPFESIYTQLQQSPLFDLFDKGQVSESDFLKALKTATEASIDNDKLLAAWNAMLLDFPIERLQALRQLKPHYRLFLLSNTNETHIREFEKQLMDSHGFQNLEPFFEKVYYSCRMNQRKPDAEIFEYVLQENGLLAAETIFIDDSPQHIEGALKAGIQAHLLPKNKDVTVLLKELKLLN